MIHAGVDLRDHWRRSADGRRLLSLRRIRVLARALPHDSMTNLALGGHGWSGTELLLADLLHAWTGEAHPEDPRVKTKNAAPPREAIEAASKRAAARRRELGITGSVLRTAS